MRLQQPRLPCLLFGKDGRNAVPMELCRFVGGNKAGVLTAEERSEVVKKTSEAPEQRKATCDRLLRDHQCKTADFARCFGITYGEQLMVGGRRLPSMQVAFGGHDTATPDDNGAWNLFSGRSEFRFAQPAYIGRIVVVELCPIKHQCAKTLFNELLRLGNERGMQLPARFDVISHDMLPAHMVLEDFLHRELGPEGRRLGQDDLLCAVLPEKARRTEPLYQQLKGWCFAQGVPSQCVLINTVRRRR